MAFVRNNYEPGLAIPMQENTMYQLTHEGSSLDQITQYELVLSHCFKKLGLNNQRWHHAAAFTAAIDYARKSGYLNAKNELTLQGKGFAALQSLEFSDAA